MRISAFNLAPVQIAWIACAVSKRFSRNREKFGTGHVEGLVDAGTANNAGLSGAWVPALVIGIPGDSITAIAIGKLLKSPDYRVEAVLQCKELRSGFSV